MVIFILNEWWFLTCRFFVYLCHLIIGIIIIEIVQIWIVFWVVGDPVTMCLYTHCFARMLKSIHNRTQLEITLVAEGPSVMWFSQVLGHLFFLFFMLVFLILLKQIVILSLQKFILLWHVPIFLGKYANYDHEDAQHDENGVVLYDQSSWFNHWNFSMIR